ncbi:MAG: septum formation family protein [Actinobacteria bacterium]|nr:septum formation family protein [Actinomycetota bacterium]
MTKLDYGDFLREVEGVDRQQRRRRRDNRKKRLGSWLRGLAVVLLVVGVVAIGRTQLAATHSAPPNLAAEQSTTTTTVAAVGNTTTTFQLTRRTYQPGDCVTWTQEYDAGRERTTWVVPCTDPHLVEVTGHISVAGRFDSFPTDQEWERLVWDQDCAELARTYLGHLDPNGRYSTGGVQPTRESWAGGDRDVWCGVTQSWTEAHHDPEMFAPFTGAVKGASQDLLYGTGACVLTTPDRTEGTVPCAETHQQEVTGTVELKKAAGAPYPTDAQWWSLIGNRCDNLARTYLGRPLTGNLRVSTVGLTQGSWDVGRRTAECTVGRYSGDSEVPVTGSLKTQR